MIWNNIILYILMFFTYAFLGWCGEVAFAAFCESRFVNRGFLNGPLCPIYGFGVMTVLAALQPISDNLVLLYIGSAFVTTLLEYVTGFVLEKLFHTRWWDYTNMPLNISGYVCLPFSLLWGVACLVIVKMIHPTIRELLLLPPFAVQAVFAVLFCLTMIVDIAATVSTIIKMNERLRKLDEMAQSIHRMSDELGETIAENTISAQQKMKEGEERLETFKTDTKEKLTETKTAAKERIDRENARIGEIKTATKERITQTKQSTTERLAETKQSVTGRLADTKNGALSRVERENARRKAQLQKMRDKLENALAPKSFGERRLMEAFPKLKHSNYTETMEAVRRKFEKKK